MKIPHKLQLIRHQLQLRNNGKGMVALPAVLLISGLTLEISLALALVSYYLVQSGFGGRISAEALSIAQAGIDDAIIRVTRDRSFNSSGYILNIDASHKATVVVCKDSKTIVSFCDTPSSGQDEITSTSGLLGKNKRLRAILDINPDTGEVRAESIGEISL